MGTQSQLATLALFLVAACGGGGKSTEVAATPAPVPTSSATAQEPVTTSVVAPAPSASSTAPAKDEGPKEKITFVGAKEFAVGTTVEFSKTTRRQNVPLKDGIPGKATVTERTIAGTITVKEVDEKKRVKLAEVAFLPTSTDGPATMAPKPPQAQAKDAKSGKDATKEAPKDASKELSAFYAGKKFLVKKGDKGLEISDAKGKPAFSDASSIQFLGSIVAQMIPMDSFGFGHSLANKLGGRTLEVGSKVDDLGMHLPAGIYMKDRTMVLARSKDGIAMFEVRGERSSENNTGTIPSKSAGQAESHIQVELATSLWTSVKYKNSSQFESTMPKTGTTMTSTWEEDVAITRTVK